MNERGGPDRYRSLYCVVWKATVSRAIAMTFSRSDSGDTTFSCGPKERAHSQAISSISKPTDKVIHPSASVSRFSPTRAKRPAKLKRGKTYGETLKVAK